jgi:hypothetical protein
MTPGEQAMPPHGMVIQPVELRHLPSKYLHVNKSAPKQPGRFPILSKDINITLVMAYLE